MKMSLETSDIPTSDSSLAELKARFCIGTKSKDCAGQCARILKETTPIKMHKNTTTCTRTLPEARFLVQSHV
jgi:hypothetical protein